MADETETGLTRDVGVTRICWLRDAAIYKMTNAIAWIERGHAEAAEAAELASQAASGRRFTVVDYCQTAPYRRLFEPFDAAGSLAAFQADADASIWMHLLSATGLERLMDATTRAEFVRQLSSDVPPCTEDNLSATFEALHRDAGLIFQRGLAVAFTGLDPRFKSHDAFRFEDRVIFTHVFDEYGHLNWNSHAMDKIVDVERVLAVLDKAQAQGGELRELVRAARDRTGTAIESRYFRIRGYKNGNAHLWFTRHDLVDAANRVLADYYGAVLPDAAPHDVEQPITGELAKSLQFYRTPDAAAERLIDGLYVPEGGHILEPSAGDGALVAKLLARFPTCTIDAVEVDAERARSLGRFGPRVRVLPANFLRLPVRAEYHAVVMNPPFSGTHWMDHVRHAYGFLRAGYLRAILPATAEVGRSAAHDAFRAWLAARQDAWRSESARFYALPPESFAESGTRVQTVTVELVRRAS